MNKVNLQKRLVKVFKINHCYKKKYFLYRFHSVWNLSKCIFKQTLNETPMIYNIGRYDRNRVMENKIRSISKGSYQKHMQQSGHFKFSSKNF